MKLKKELMRKTAAVLSMTAMLLPNTALWAHSTQSTQPSGTGSQGLFTMKVNTDIVLVSVTARDKQGTLIRDLKQSDFTLVEDGKTQQLRSFDVEDAQTFAKAGPEQAESQGPVPAQVMAAQKVVAPEVLRDRRLIVLFFDLSSMEPEELERAASSAQKYIDKQMSPADLVAIVTFDTSLQMRHDFTADKVALKHSLNVMLGIEGQGLANGATGTDEGAADTGQNFTADDTEYNTFNTDRRLQAIASLSQALAKINQKKAVLYFSSGLQKTGTENQAQLRQAINMAVKSNVSIYPVDSRGLEAFAPGGSAQNASLRGTSAYSGKAVLDQYDSNFATQETLTTIASDTGGKAFLDSNDFGKAYDKVQADTSTYYVLGYRSTNPAMDGHYRKITVKVNRPDIKLEYRQGYYGPRDFKHYTKDDREQQLDDEIASDLPETDVPVYLESEYFRAKDDKFYIPVSLVVPGSAIPFAQSNDKDKASIDVIGVVRDKQTKFPVGQVRENVKLTFEGTKQIRSKNVQYNTGFLLPAGTYHVKFVVRENENGRMGCFETDLVVPDLRKQPLKMSSVVLASQHVPNAAKRPQNPLIRNGREIIPNVAHVFMSGQPLMFYYEVYDAAKPKAVEGEPKDTKRGNVRLLTSVQFFRGKIKVYETALLEAHDVTYPDRKASAFELEVPTTELKPGWYTCQINVVDDAGGTFAFPRLPILIKGVETKTAQATTVQQ
jgi:VWFA-related protein